MRALVLALLAATAAAAPSVQLAAALNATTCPMRIEIDKDLSRIPVYIKNIRCAARSEGTDACARAGVPARECCQHAHGGVRLRCVELRDSVPVRDAATGARRVLDVAVGCACVLAQLAAAHTLPAPPGLQF